jgi:hypothetical protein
MPPRWDWTIRDLIFQYLFLDPAPGGAESGDFRDRDDEHGRMAQHLKRSKDHGVSTIDGRSVADPGFITALQKISKSYEQPE